MTATRTAKNNKLRLAKHQHCTCIRLFCTFLCRRYTTTTWNFLISRFVENVNTRQRLPFSFSELWYSPLKLISRKIHQHWIERNGISAIKFEAERIHFLSDVFVAVVVFVCLSSLPCIGLQICNLRKQPIFRDTTTRFSIKWRLKNRTSTEVPYWLCVTVVTRRLFCKSTRFEAFSNAG